MFEDALESGGSTQSSMFPFLSVLFCMIGALVVIMVMGSIRTTLKSTDIVAKIGEKEQEVITREEITNLGAEIALLVAKANEGQAYISSTQGRIARGSSEVKNVSARLSDLRREGKEARSRSAKVVLVRKRDKAHVARRDLIGRKQATAKQIAEADKRTKELKAASAKLTAERDELKSKAESPEVRFRLVDEDPGRTPVYLELDRDAELDRDVLVVHSDGTPRGSGAKIPVGEALARGGYLEKLAAKLARHGSSRYAMLLVRPKTADSFHAVKAFLRSLRVPFAYEPIDKGWKFAFR